MSTGFRRLFGLPSSAWGAAFGHIGMGVVMLGIVATEAFQEEKA